MTDTASTEVAYDDLPEGKWYVEARSGDTVARLFFGRKKIVSDAYHVGLPRLVVLTPRPLWHGVELPEQGEGLLVDGRATFVEDVPSSIANPIVHTLLAYGIYAARSALAALLPDSEPQIAP